MNDNAATFRTDASTSQAPPFALPTESSSSWALLPTAGLRLTPDLAMHLYECKSPVSLRDERRWFDLTLYISDSLPTESALR